ncbi:MAG: hypothetical protein PHE56_04280 [Bacteroidales bacterium]|nr:hypothetical protein [Bacteroidales bacterium]
MIHSNSGVKRIILLVALLLTLKISAQENKYIYSGGMLFLQPGYTIAHNPYQNIEATGFGIGGILRFYIGNHFCTGIYGGSQKTHYNSTGSANSYISLGYGGPFVGYTYFKNRMRLCLSVGAGGGKIRNLHIQTQTGSVLNQAEYFINSAFVAYPMISLDYMMTQKIAFTSQLICIGALYNQNDLYFCPVFQIGILFNR